MKQTLDSLLQELNLMAEAIPSYIDIVSVVGITEESAQKLKDFKTNLEKLNSEQEKLKTELKLKTEMLQKEQEVAVKLYAEYKKLIKIKVDKGSWKAFGILDKR